MAKITNWSRVDSDEEYPRWRHDETGDEISVGPGDDVEYHSDGTPAMYMVTLWSRDGMNNRVIGEVSSLEKAKEIARQEARQNLDGELLRTKSEEFQGLSWGELEE